MFRLPRKGDKVRCWTIELVAGFEMRVQIEAFVTQRKGRSIYMNYDGRNWVTPTREMEILK